jgi:fructose-1,6-bisphosphatase/inositol monophosphatase family enzyme
MMTFQRNDLERLADIVSIAADQEIMPRFRKLSAGAVREKTSALDLVTDADEAAEAAIKAAVAKAFPKAAFIGEESVEKDHSLLGKISDAELAIIIDPVDGTSNFAWGLPLFGVLAAVTSHGETIGGIIYDPVGRDCTFALKSHGAWAKSESGSTRDLRVSKPAALSQMTGTASWYLMPEPLRSQVAANLAKIKASFAYRCAAYEYRLVGSGLVDFSLHYKLMPWDHAAGVLIHAEAGGYSALYDGSPYAPAKLAGGLILAPSKENWQALRDALVG